MDMLARLIGAGVAFGATKAAEHGVSLSVEAQAALTVAIYGVAHRATTWVIKRTGHAR